MSRRFAFFGFFSKTGRKDTLKSLMVNLVYLTDIYEEVYGYFSRISDRFAGTDV